MPSNTDKINALRLEADRLEAIEKHFQSLPDEEKLAITLHQLLCRWNHIDGCSWEYEGYGGKTDWTAHAHSHYLEKSRNIIGFCNCNGISIENAITILGIAKKL